jgi:hypothetical protein
MDQLFGEDFSTWNRVRIKARDFGFKSVKDWMDSLDYMKNIGGYQSDNNRNKLEAIKKILESK